MTSTKFKSLPLMLVPPRQAREKIQPQQWKSCISAWSSISSAYLSLPPSEFLDVLDYKASLVSYLVSYVQELAQVARDGNLLELEKDTILRKNVFLIIHRTFHAVQEVPKKLLHWTFLADFSTVYGATEACPRLFQDIGTNHGAAIETSLVPVKLDLITSLDKGRVTLVQDETLMQQLLHLTKSSPQTGVCLLTGSDLLDSLALSYPQLSTPSRTKVTMLVFLCLSALMQGPTANYSLLIDHLYSLKSFSTSSSKSNASEDEVSLLRDLIASTPLLPKLQKEISGPESARARGLIATLESLSKANVSALRPPGSTRTKPKPKGKTPASPTTSPSPNQQALITQLQDLFPSLGTSFTLNLLEYYNLDLEAATSALLEENLPPHLATADRSENLPSTSTGFPSTSPSADLVPDMPPQRTPSPSPASTSNSKPRTMMAYTERRNIHDTDAFSSLSISPDRIHIGRANASATADDLIAQGAGANKSAIFSALATFDADDDERDDTYDLADVGGSVDDADGRVGDEVKGVASTQRDPQTAKVNEGVVDERDATLFRACKANPKVFERDSATRRSRAREVLRKETGLSDEGVEGWAIMLQREPRRLRSLEERFSLAVGGIAGGTGQRELERTSWRSGGGGGEEDNDTETGTDDPTTQAPRGGRGGRAGRRAGGPIGSGRGRGRGASVAGPSNETSTQNARHRKEATKSSKANHNRRDARAKKIGRGFGGGAGMG